MADGEVADHLVMGGEMLQPLPGFQVGLVGSVGDAEQKGGLGARLAPSA